jgi:ABC-type multidrug transport system fused ATPase/permease subunit
MSKPSQNLENGRFTYSHRGWKKRVEATYSQAAELVRAPKAPKEPLAPQLPNLDVSHSEAGLAALAGILAFEISRSFVWPLSERSVSVTASVAFEIALLTMLIGLPIIYREQSKRRQTAETQMSSYENALQEYLEKMAAYQEYLAQRESFLRLMTAGDLGIPLKVANKTLDAKNANSL